MKNEEISPNIFDYIDVVLRQRGLGIVLFLVLSILSVGAIAVWPKSYRAESVILPVSSSESADLLSGLPTDLLGLGKALDGSGSTMGTPKTLLAILKSRTIAENVVNRENLIPVLLPPSFVQKQSPARVMETAVNILQKKKITFVSKSKSPTITIEGKFKDPTVSARVVNAFVEELKVFVQENALTSAKRKRIFLEKQVSDNEVDVLSSGKELDTFYQRNSIMSDRAKIDVRVQTPVLPQSQRSKSDGAVSAPAVEQARIVKDVPQKVYFDFLTQQNLTIGKIMELLMTQEVMARVDEERDEPTFQILDQARIPARHYFPKYELMIPAALFLSALTAVALIFLREYFSVLLATRRNRQYSKNEQAKSTTAA